MGEGVSNKENPVSTTQGIFETSTIHTYTSLPPLLTNVSTSTHSPTFDHVMTQPITSLFLSQSTEQPKIINDDEIGDGGFGVSHPQTRTAEMFGGGGRYIQYHNS